MPATERRPIALLALLAGLTALAPLSIDVVTPSFPAIRDDLGAPDWAVQASVTACLLGIGCGQLLLGPLSDRVGRRPVVVAGVLGWTAASLLSAVAVDAAWLVVARAVAGLTGAAAIVVARSVVRDVSDASALLSGRISLLATVSAAAPVVAPALGSAVAAVGGWRADFLLLAAVGVLALLAVLVLLPETLPAGPRATASVVAGLRTAMADRELRLVALALGAQSFGFYAYIATASFVVEHGLGYGPAVFALVFGTNAAAMLAANLVFRRLMRIRSPRELLGGGLTGALSAGLLLLLLGTTGAPHPLLWAASTLFAAAMGFVLPGAHSWGQLTAVPSGAGSALTGSAQFVGGAAGSPVTGLIGTTVPALGLLVAGSAAVALLARRRAAVATRTSAGAA